MPPTLLTAAAVAAAARGMEGSAGEAPHWTIPAIATCMQSGPQVLVLVLVLVLVVVMVVAVMMVLEPPS